MFKFNSYSRSKCDFLKIFSSNGPYLLETASFLPGLFYLKCLSLLETSRLPLLQGCLCCLHKCKFDSSAFGNRYLISTFDAIGVAFSFFYPGCWSVGKSSRSGIVVKTSPCSKSSSFSAKVTASIITCVDLETFDSILILLWGA